MALRVAGLAARSVSDQLTPCPSASRHASEIVRIAEIMHADPESDLLTGAQRARSRSGTPSYPLSGPQLRHACHPCRRPERTRRAGADPRHSCERVAGDGRAPQGERDRDPEVDADLVILLRPANRRKRRHARRVSGLANAFFYAGALAPRRTGTFLLRRRWRSRPHAAHEQEGRPGQGAAKALDIGDDRRGAD